MKLAFVFLSLTILTSCSTVNTSNYATDEQKTFVSIKEVPFSATESYEKALQFFAESLVNSNDAIQIKDKENNHITTNISMQCQLNDMNVPTPVAFSVDFSSKEKKIRTQVKVRYAYHLIPLTGITSFDITTEQLPSIGQCQKDFTAKLEKFLQEKKTEW